MTRQDSITGCLLGTAVGDAVGLACEGLSPKRQARLFPSLNGPRLLGHGGMVSDDTEHTCLVAQALIESGGNPELFQRALARRLRGWLFLIPAGVGWATLRASLKLCGGDTDTTGAIAGALVGAGVGPAGIPADWLSSLREWPRTSDWMTGLGTTLASVLDTRQPQKPPGLLFLPLLARNTVFAAVVLAHGFRRLLPPY